MTKLRSPFVKLCERSKLTIHGAAPSSCEPVVTVAKGIFCIRVDIRAIQSQREFIHSVRSITHRTDKQILTYFYLHSCHGCLIRYILIRKITSGACHFNAGYRILNQFIESRKRNQLGRSGIKVPLQIKVIIIRRFQIGVTLTVEVHADITVREIFPLPAEAYMFY